MIIRIIILAMFAVVLPQQTFAQTFTDQLTRKVEGQGTVTLTQEQRITDLINGSGTTQTSSTSTADRTTGADDDIVPVVPTGKKTKVRGFRIQVYWGGSLRTDQSKAQAAGIKVTTVFPELQAYTSFESPHWRCRVGDFLTREEASECFEKLRNAGLAGEAMIVRSEVYTYK